MADDDPSLPSTDQDVDPNGYWSDLVQRFDPTQPPFGPTILGPAPSGSAFDQVLVHIALGGDPNDLPPEYRHIVPHVSLLLQPPEPLGPGLLGDVRGHLASSPAQDGLPAGPDNGAEGDGGDDDGSEGDGGASSAGEGPGPDIPSSPATPISPLDTEPPDFDYTPLRGHQLGDLSMQAESGFGPGHEAQAAGRVSSGAGAQGRPDPGGVSYGAFQLASKTATLGEFLRSPEGAPWAARLRSTDATSANGNFAQAWKAIATRDGQAFFDAQKQFIKRTHYDPVVSAVFRAAGLDIDERSPAVQDAVWSAAVQHGATGAKNLVLDAVQDTNRVVRPSEPAYDGALISNLYGERSRQNPAGAVRYRQERAQALQGLSDW